MSRCRHFGAVAKFRCWALTIPTVGHLTCTKLMSFYGRRYSNHVPSQFQTSSLNHVICITRWQMLCTVLRHLSLKHNLFRTSKQICDALNFALLQWWLIFIFTFTRCLQEALSKSVQRFFSSPARVGQFQLLYAVANYVFPKHWSLLESQSARTCRCV